MQVAIFDSLEPRQYFTDEQNMLWMHGTLLCQRLGYKNVSQAVTMHTDEDERRQEVIDGRTVWFVSEPGVWGLILSAKTDEAKVFKRELKHSILPKLRSQGYYVARSDDETLANLKAHIVELEQQNALAFNEGKQAVAALLPQPDRALNPERHIYKVAVCCLRVLSLSSKAMDAFEVAQRMHQEALDGAWLMQPEYRDALLQSADSVTIDFALQCLSQLELVDFNGRHAKLKITKPKAAKVMDELLHDSGKLYNPLTENISHWQESIAHWHQ